MEYNPNATAAYLAGAIDEYVKFQGRDTVMRSASRDAHARYARIPAPGACKFCVMLGSRGFVYRSEATASTSKRTGEQFHRFCNCQIAVCFDPAIEEYYVGWTKVTRGYGDGQLVRSGADGSRELREVDIDALYDSYKEEIAKHPLKSKLRDYMAQTRLSDEEFDAAMKRLSDARTLNELHAVGREIVDGWPDRGAGRDKAQWNEMSRHAQELEERFAGASGAKSNLNIEIDEYVPCLVRKSDGAVLPTYVSEVQGKELKGYNKRTGWFVNWQKDMEIDGETGLPIKKYKLMVDGSDEIQGLIGIIEPEHENDSLYVSWAVANPKSQSRVVGKDNKEYIGIGGHLFAIACEKSQDLGRGGEWFGFARNAELYEYYVERIGMDDIGGGVVALSSEKAKEIMGIYNYEWAG